MNSNIMSGALKLPKFLSDDARDLVTRLLRRNPMDRLGAGPMGAVEIKTHPFFDAIRWEDVYNKKYPFTFRFKKAVNRQEISIEAYIEAIGKQEENYRDNWSFIRQA